MTKSKHSVAARGNADPIWLICQVFFPDTQSTSQLLSGVLRVLAERGERFIVLSGYPAVPALPNAPSSESWEGIHIERGGMRSEFKRSLVRRAFSYASYSAFVCWRLLRAPAGQRVWVVTNPPYHPALIARVCRWKKHSCVLMLQDIYPEGLEVVGRLTAGGLMARLWHGANRGAFRMAHEIWVLGRDMAALVEQRYSVPAARIRVVPHWSSVETDEHLKAEETALHRQLGLHGKFIVQYSGNMGLWHDMDTIVRAASLLQACSNIHFLLVGAGIKRAGAERLAAELELGNVSWLPYQPRELLTDSLACCHVALVSQLRGLAGVAVPCKIYGILASGRALVAQVPADSEVGLVVAETNCGVVVPPDEPAALASVLRRLAEHPETVQHMAARARAAYAEHYTLARGADRIARAFGTWPGSASRPRESTR